MLELADANVSPTLAGAWDTAVADVRHEADGPDASRQAECGTLVDAALAYG